jgi:hypothetical protein
VRLLHRQRRGASARWSLTATLALSILYQRLDLGQQAQAELTTAAELYRAMEMTFWLETAEAVLAQVAR